MWILKGNIFQVKIDCTSALPGFIKREIAEGVYKAYELYLELAGVSSEEKCYIGLYYLSDQPCTLIGFAGTDGGVIDPETGEAKFDWEEFKDEAAAIVVQTLTDFGMRFPVIISDLPNAL